MNKNWLYQGLYFKTLPGLLEYLSIIKFNQNEDLSCKYHNTTH